MIVEFYHPVAVVCILSNSFRDIMPILCRGSSNCVIVRRLLEIAQRLGFLTWDYLLHCWN